MSYIKPSPTLEIASQAQKLKMSGRDIISLLDISILKIGKISLLCLNECDIVITVHILSEI